MLTIKTEKNQSFLDVALQHYGNIDGIINLIKDNDFVGKLLKPGSVPSDEVDLATSFKEGISIVIDDTADVYSKMMVDEIAEELEKVGSDAIATGLNPEEIRIFNGVFDEQFG